MVQEALRWHPHQVVVDDLKAVLFDFDYTLGDSSAGIVECVELALADVGGPVMSRDQILATIGLSLEASFRELTGDPSLDAAATFARSFHAHADELMEGATVIYPPVTATLADLRQRGLATAIVTTKLRRRVAGILARNGLRDAFDVLVGADDVGLCKPDPAGIQLALANLATPRDAAVYVGDHAVDAVAAEAAGVPFVGVLSGMSSRGELTRYPHLAIVDGIADLLPTLGLTA